MVATATVDASELQKLPTAFRAIAHAARATGRTVLMGEAGIILKACAVLTKVSTVAKVDHRTARQVLGKRGLDLTGADGTAPGDITVNAGHRGPFGRVWVRSPKIRHGKPTGRPFRLAGQINKTNFNFRPQRYHQKSGIWTDIRETAFDVAYQMRKAIPAGRKAIGLARQSWVQIADSLGIRLETVRGGGMLSSSAIAKARAAIASNGLRFINGLSSAERNARGIVLTLRNRYPAGRRMGMDATLQRVVLGRVRYFDQNFRRGVFESVQKVARAYPYLSVRAV